MRRRRVNPTVSNLELPAGPSTTRLRARCEVAHEKKRAEKSSAALAGCLAYRGSFGGVRLGAVSAAPSPASWLSLVRLGGSSESYEHHGSERIGYSQPRGLAVSGGTHGRPRDTGPRISNRNRVHPLMSLPPLQSPSRSVVRPRRMRPGTSHGVLRPHRDLSAASPLTGEDPASPTFRPRCFSHPRRFTPRCALWACFIPLPRPGFPLQGLSPLPSRHASSAPRALLSLAAFACHRETQ